MTRPLLLVRPEPGLSASMARARALGLDVAGVALFEVAPVAWSAPPADQFDAMLLTSANAVRHGGAGLSAYTRLPVHAVGNATAAAAREAGLAVRSVGDDDVAALLDRLPPTLRLFHPAGRHRTPIGDRRPVVAVTVYEAREVIDPALPDLRGWVVAVHSPRAGHRLAVLTDRRDETAIAAISAAAAAACGPGWQRIEIADAPSDERLLALAAELCQTDRP